MPTSLKRGSRIVPRRQVSGHSPDFGDCRSQPSTADPHAGVRHFDPERPTLSSRLSAEPPDALQRGARATPTGASSPRLAEAARRLCGHFRGSGATAMMTPTRASHFERPAQPRKESNVPQVEPEVALVSPDLSMFAYPLDPSSAHQPDLWMARPHETGPPACGTSVRDAVALVGR
jgi:hypothetical protein